RTRTTICRTRRTPPLLYCRPAVDAETRQTVARGHARSSGLVPPPSPATGAAPASVLVRIVLVRAGHDDDERPEHVQDLDRVALGREDLGETTVDVRALIQPPATQDHPLLPNPGFHHLSRDEAGADHLPRPAVPSPRRGGAAHHPPGAVHGRKERLPLQPSRLLVRVRSRRALDDHGIVAHRAADEALLPRKRGRRTLPHDDVLLAPVPLLPREVVVVVNELQLAPAQDLDDLPSDPLTTGVRVSAGQLHELPVVVAERRVQVEQDLRLPRVARAPLPPLRQIQEPGGNGVAEAARTEVHADPDRVRLVGEDVDVVIPAPDRAELFTSLLPEFVAVPPPAGYRIPGGVIEERIVDRRIVRAVLPSDPERDRRLDLVGQLVGEGIERERAVARSQVTDGEVGPDR